MAKWNAVTEEDLEKMMELRAKGLSNNQIALEMGKSYTTVHRFLGKQKDMARSPYGSIVGHATGESFLQEEKQPLKPKAKSLVQKAIVFDGGNGRHYKLFSDHKVAVAFPGYGITVDFGRDDLFSFLAELTELAEAMAPFS